MPNNSTAYMREAPGGTMVDRSFMGLARLAFALALAVPALLGVALLFVAHAFAPGSLAHDVVRDLGIAAFVSVIITVVIEFYARSRLQAEIRSGVIEAAVARLVPERVWEKIKIEILSQNPIRHDECRGRPDAWRRTIPVGHDPV